MEFLNHYVGSTACSPSRATLYTEQYPSLHDVIKTTRDTAKTYGDMLDAHGCLFQKWHNAYEESIHVPLIIHSPKIFSSR